ncbi:MAG TPA: 16S rRNA (uracil(1498)-N(3))-methyltransferase [Candidatus Scatomorpha merdigallinarum]|nr:16S rRNA (uracil(1498)-N(3))-methyltransferase [Candidatus Scatomorpha merdigallinarum]
MARFFMAGTNLDGGRAYIRGRDAEHVRVLRLRPGEDVVICDGHGTDYRCRIVSPLGEEVEAEVVEVVPCKGEPAVDVTVYAGLPKGERADFLIQKCVEAGAKRIVFFDCERCVAKLDGRSVDKKLERFNRISQAAAEQSGRGIIPQVDYVHDYVEMLDQAAKADTWLFMYETGDDRVPMKEAIEGAGDFKSASIVTGPEGGFTLAEARLAKGAGATLCSMGERIFRCETAPVVAVTAIMYAKGEL